MVSDAFGWCRVALKLDAVLTVNVGEELPDVARQARRFGVPQPRLPVDIELVRLAGEWTRAIELITA